MPPLKRDPTGSFPDNSPAVLLMLDVINDLDFEGGDLLLDQALPMAHHLAALKARAEAAGLACLYVNDNFGRWQSDFTRQVEHCLSDGVRGEELARLLAPGRDDYFVLKPKNSGFYGTTLDPLLEHLRTETVILTGLACNICVLFTANDAHMRGYKVIVPRDCVASERPEDTEHALNLMQHALSVKVCRSEELDLEALQERC